MNQTLREIYLNHHHTYRLKGNIRFELALDSERNYHKRIEGAKARAKKLFDAVFHDDDTIQLVLMIADYSRKERIGKYLNTNSYQIVDSFTTKAWEEYVEGITTVLVIATQMKNLRIAKTIDALCYADFCEDGKCRIKHPIHFYHSKKNTLLNIYDDRGCDIWSDNLASQKEIYKTYHDWILKYDKKDIANFYEQIDG